MKPGVTGPWAGAEATEIQEDWRALGAVVTSLMNINTADPQQAGQDTSGERV